MPTSFVRSFVATVAAGALAHSQSMPCDSSVDWLVTKRKDHGALADDKTDNSAAFAKSMTQWLHASRKIWIRIDSESLILADVSEIMI